MKHTYNELQKEQICNIVYDYLTKYGAWGGEMVGQDDEAQIGAIQLACDLADVKDVTLDIDKVNDNNYNTIWDYINSLPEGSDKWKYAIDISRKYHQNSKNPDCYVLEIKQKVDNKFK